MADASDLKSDDENREGSIPSSRTIWNPHPKQKEFFEDDRKRILYTGGYPSRSFISKWFLEILERFKK